MLLCNVIDQLHDQNGLADTCAAKKPDLPALFERHQQVDDFYAGLELFSFGGLLVKTGGMAMNRPTFLGFARAKAVYWFTNNVKDPPERGVTDRGRDGAASIDGVHATNQAVRSLHRNAPDAILA